jgi:PAS domain S-box-containing protein
LREVAGGYRSLIEELPAVTRLLWLDPLTTLYVSPHIEEHTGYPPKRWIDDPNLWIQAIHDDDRGQMLAVFAEHVANGTPISEEYRVVAPDGHIVFLREESRIVLDRSGRRVASQSVLLDVTEGKRVESGWRAALRSAGRSPPGSPRPRRINARGSPPRSTTVRSRPCPS